MSIAPPNLSGEGWFADPALQRIFALLNADGGEVRVVGGAVRNALMGVKVGDIDLATTWRPEEVVKRAAAAGIKAVPTGIDHGTVTLLIGGHGFEVTTLRHDVETDGRRATVAFGADWSADARRRDLTINALYVDQSGTVFDWVGGLADIDSRTIRFIGEAPERIAEDHLRILRYFRFFAHYGGGRPDADALRASARAKDKLATLSAERVWKELKALLGAADPGRALLWMRQAGVLAAVLPETEKWGIDSMPGLIASEQARGWEPDALMRLMAIVPPDPLRVAAMAGRLKLSRAEAERLNAWAGTPQPAAGLAETALDRMLYKHGPQPVTDRLRLALVVARGRPDPTEDSAPSPELAGLTRLLARAGRWVRPDFPLTGKDLIAAGIKPGPDLGTKLAAAEERWIHSNFVLDRAQLLAFLNLTG
ncbi:poly(A) polymerase [Hoeflea marina]|uniref:Poly(A) polymerase n=1 Tax=Hoeflea marina TaxID=274592 RepID=A0A317PHR0_9HYPH|nr:CCA tRNA nucleotidyltransferase [Hoeflea marina]PWV97573.1 poly(A) polymerase [Hoeflea marina]